MIFRNQIKQPFVVNILHNVTEYQYLSIFKGKIATQSKMILSRLKCRVNCISFRFLVDL